MKQRSRIFITTGDVDGIGLEVSLKALLKLKISPHMNYSLYRHPQVPPHLKKLLSQVKRKYLSQECSEFSKAIDSKCVLTEILSDELPPVWVQESAMYCLKNPKSTAIVTGPLSKTLCQQAGFRGLGHTDILRDLSAQSRLHMGFLGKSFNVVLFTGHIPLNEVSKKITTHELVSTAKIVASFFSNIPKLSNKPIGLLGLNPHAGESGLIGHEENKIINAAIQECRAQGINIVGPLVPDSAFLKKSWNQFSCYLCLYHDQGLIPFKTIHGQDSGAHVTLGLPFIRTSVDHGTAKDIYAKNIANPASMGDALRWANILLKRKIL